MRYAKLVLFLGLVVSVACATAGERSATTSRDVLGAEEIREAGSQLRTALDAVEQLRPHFLRSRANPTAGVGARRVDPVVVYVNGTSWGGPEALSRIRVGEVGTIRFVRPSDAQTRYGMGHGSGAIEVTLAGSG